MKDARTGEESLRGLHEVPKIQAGQAVYRGVRVPARRTPDILACSREREA